MRKDRAEIARDMQIEPREPQLKEIEIEIRRLERKSEEARLAILKARDEKAPSNQKQVSH
jgi:hypothetical protein